MTTMAPRIKSELLESRRICLKTFKKECDWGCDCTATNVDRKEADNGSVRVGSPFLHQPITIDRFSPTHDNLQLLEAVKRLLKFKVEKCCNNLIAHYVDLYLHGDKVQEMEQFAGRYYTTSWSLADDLKKQVNPVSLGDKVFLEVQVETVWGVSDVQTNGTACNRLAKEITIKYRFALPTT